MRKRPPIPWFDEVTLTRHRKWSDSTFGDKSVKGPKGPLKHLSLEALEAADAPDDISEFADCAFLLLDALHRAGFTFDDLNEGMRVKFEILIKRDYTTNQSNDPDTPTMHKK